MNTDLPTLCLVLKPQGHDCTLMLDDVDVSRYVRGVDVRAHVGELTEVRVTLLAKVTIIGEAGRISFRKVGDDEV